jgi:aldose 1-epimerase
MGLVHRYFFAVSIFFSYAPHSFQVITYGAAVTTLKVPGKGGVIDDVVWGFDDMKGYLSSDNSAFGATMGRTANRIGKGKFTLDGVDYQVSLNENGKQHLHGGIKGFDKVG